MAEVSARATAMPRKSKRPGLTGPFGTAGISRSPCLRRTDGNLLRRDAGPIVGYEAVDVESAGLHTRPALPDQAHSADSTAGNDAADHRGMIFNPRVTADAAAHDPRIRPDKDRSRRAAGRATAAVRVPYLAI